MHSTRYNYQDIMIGVANIRPRTRPVHMVLIIVIIILFIDGCNYNADSVVDKIPGSCYCYYLRQGDYYFGSICMFVSLLPTSL